MHLAGVCYGQYPEEVKNVQDLQYKTLPTSMLAGYIILAHSWSHLFILTLPILISSLIK